LRLLQTGAAPSAEALDDRALARADLDLIHRHGLRLDAVVGAPAREVRDTRAGHHRLGRRAPDVDAGASDLFALDQRGAAARARQIAGERHAGLTGSDDDGVEMVEGAHTST